MKTFPLRVMWDQIAPYYLQYKNLVSDPDEITKKVSDFYFNGTSPRQASLSAFSDVSQLQPVLKIKIAWKYDMFE